MQRRVGVRGGGGGGGVIGGIHGVNVAVDWNHWLILKYGLHYITMLLSAESKANSPKHPKLIQLT